MIDLNGTQAAIWAGYSPKTAGQQAEQLLKKLEIQQYVSNLIKKRSERTEITADMVLQEFALMGFANMLDYIAIEDGIARIACPSYLQIRRWPSIKSKPNIWHQANAPKLN